jgi:RNA polymerase sigma-B factor
MRPEQLVERYLPLADKLALRYRHTAEPLDDLIQVARLGLIKAARRWDPDRGLAFSTFAVPTILGELRRHFRDSTWAVKPPRDVQELGLALPRVRETLSQELRREPSARDIADHLDLPIEDVLEAIMAKDGYKPDSLDAPIAADHEGGAAAQDWLVDERADYGESDARVLLSQLAADLDDRERELLRLRFQEDLTQREIGDRLGCSQMHVSRMLQTVMERLSADALVPRRPGAQPGGESRPVAAERQRAVEELGVHERLRQVPT